MYSGSLQAPARGWPTWLVLILAALLAVPLLAVPAGAAPPVTAITEVTITGELSGTGDCVWRMEATIENFRGGGKNFFASLGDGNGSQETDRQWVKGKVTTFVWVSPTRFRTLNTWAVSADNNRGRQATAGNSAAGIVCGAQ